MSTIIVNSFRSAGIFPVNFLAIRPEKLAPATVYTTVPAPSMLESGQVSEASKVSLVPALTNPEPAQVKQTSEVPAPSKTTSTQVKKASEVALEAFEGALDEETRESFVVHFEEGYDLENDELYSVWMKLKSLSIDDKQSLQDHSEEVLGKQCKPDLRMELRSNIRSMKEGKGEQKVAENEQKPETAIVAN